MITYVEGDLFQSSAQVLVNAVNTVGVMGKGVALEFKKRYPDMFKSYRSLCERKMLGIGNLQLYKTSDKWVLNFPTKRNWRQPSKPEYLEAGLKRFVEIYHKAEIESIAFPLIGCGNGELSWESTVRPLMERYLQKLPIQIFIHSLKSKNRGIPEHQDPVDSERWFHAEPESLSFRQVFEELDKKLVENPTFTVSEAQGDCRAEIEDDKLVVQSNAGTFEVEYDELLVIWQRLRRLGYLSIDLVEEEIPFHFLCPVLLKLPYAVEIKVSHGAEKTKALKLLAANRELVHDSAELVPAAVSS